MIPITSCLTLYMILFGVGVAIDLVLTGINIRHLKTHGHIVPEPFQGYIDEGRLSLISDYTVDGERFDTITTVINSGCFLLVILFGWLPALQEWLHGFELGVIPTGMAFFAVLGLAQMLFSLPFSYYRTFVIEEKYGFNASTLKTWLTDIAKGICVGAVIGGVLLLVILGLVGYAGRLWWLWAWAAFFSFQLLLLIIYPTVIAPWFNKFEPLDDQDLEAKVREMTRRGGLSVEGVFKMDAGRRSRHTNAYFTGLGKTKRIVLFDTLLASHSHEEILSVLAHEVGHWRKGHVFKKILIVGFFSLLIFYMAALGLKWEGLYSAFGFGQPISYVGLFLAVLWWEVISPLFGPVNNWLSRRFERQADAFAVGLSKTSAHLKNALRRLAKENLSNLYPHPVYAWVYYSHPPLLERIRNLERMGRPG